ncbi:MAG: hypothetical protein HYU84_09835, partial [Chloroflexi bacterium]|nr:hypothetical protein [Chloroflexota bacterium]
ILVNGSIDTSRRAFQPGFDKIVILQLALSILGWGLLAWVVAESLRNPWLKVLSASLILGFAYTPQMAAWDSILMSESLTFSLFALQLALLIKIASTLSNEPNANVTGWAIVWGIATFFWTFLRDTNLFTALMTIGMVAILFVSQRYRKNKTLTGITIFLSLMFAIGLYTSSISVRSTVQLVNLYKDDIFPNPVMVSFFREYGMPDFGTLEFEEWVQEHGSSAMARFMFSHPGYPVLKIVRDFGPSFNEIKQTYFTARNLNPSREVLFGIGNALHPENTTPFLMSVVLLLGTLLLAVKNVDDSRLWAWLGLWLFFSSSLTLIPTILGDTWALNRHALYSTTIFRFIMWVFPIIILDIALRLKPSEN